MISIVIPLYNKKDQVSNTIATVLAQTYQDFEVIIVNDGSTDDSVAEVEKVQDSRIRLIHQQNAGVSVARNRGIEASKGDLIAFLDADDEWNPGYLESQYQLFRKYPDCSVFACNYEFRDVEGKVTPTIIRKLSFAEEDGILTNYFEVASCSHPPLWTSAIMVKKNAIQAIGGFPVGIKSGEDLLTWARLSIRGQIAFCKTPLAIYNLGEGYDYTHLPPRRQDRNDPVGKSLLQLYKSHSSVIGLRHYISHWHRMRASVAIRFGEREETIREVMIGLYYNPFNIRLIIFFLLAVCPSKIRYIIISKHQS
ncbi:glycosyl transferase, group 2 family protein [human gut metagenome]|uniref:Glycosyl transferase, group 2 family protein n=1 Tax=human gut metagenome TaxID=408170 RepID=K1SJY5_9ZZZZ